MSLKNSLIIATLLTCISAANSVQASGVYLLQLGSFEDKGKAQERWEILQGKYPSLLGDLDVRLMDVTLPPDNFTVYRTQAGALSNRADAQSICDRLSSRGDECYVVETAMFNPARSGSVAPNPPLSIDGQQHFGMASAPLAPSIKTPAVSAPRVAAPAISAPHVIAPAISAPRVTAPSLISSGGNVPESLVETVNPLEPVKQEKKKSFWSWLNPFGGDDNVKEDTDDVMDVDTGAPSAPMPELAMESPSLDTDFPTLQADVPPLVETPNIPAVNMDMEVPVNRDPRMDIDLDDPFQLPPPPPPANEQVMAQVAQERADAARRIGGATMAPAPLSAGTPREIAPKLFTDSTPSLAGSAQGVDVEEAIQVPLSGQTVPNLPSNRFPTASEMRMMGMPSQATKGKTLWAQIYYFADQQAALGYWDAFRNANPEFPAKRVRVTKPYLSSGKQRVSLRVGPFANANDITQLCSDIETQEIRCSAMADIGASSARGTGARGLSNRYAKRYQSAPRLKHSMYWVQLGSYDSPDQAHAAFSQLSMAARPMMDSIQPNIASPIMGSEMEPIYRLRVGPYAMRASADQLCANLRGRGTSCAVIFGK